MMRWEKITSYGHVAERYIADVETGRYTIRRRKRSKKWTVGFDGIEWSDVFASITDAQEFAERKAS